MDQSTQTEIERLPPTQMDQFTQTEPKEQLEASTQIEVISHVDVSTQTEIAENDVSTQTEIAENDTLNLLDIIINQNQLIDMAENNITQLKEGLEDARESVTYRDGIINELRNKIELKDSSNNPELNEFNDARPSSRSIIPEYDILNNLKEIQQLDKSFLNKTIDIDTYQDTLNKTMDTYQNTINNPTIIITPPNVTDVTGVNETSGDSPTGTTVIPYKVDHMIIQIDPD
jgi:hypothetical protein